MLEVAGLKHGMREERLGWFQKTTLRYAKTITF